MALLIIYDEDNRLSRSTVNARRLQRGVRLLPVAGGVSNLLATLDDFLLSRRSAYNRVVFVTHASPGRIIFGGQGINANWVTSNMRNRQYEKLCPTRSRIYFSGCRVAAGPGGRALFQSIAAVFLKNAGGEIFGHTSDGWTVPFYSWATGRVVHFTGELVTLNFGPGGRILGDRTESIIRI